MEKTQRGKGCKPYSEMSWWDRWRAVIAVAAVVTISWTVYLVSRGRHIETATIGCVGIVMAVFIGVLIRNTSLAQDERSEKQIQAQTESAGRLFEREMSVRRREVLMQRQVAAINHMCSSIETARASEPDHACEKVPEPVRAAAVTEMVWLICAWNELAARETEMINNDTTITAKDQEITMRQLGEERRDHCLELVYIAYRNEGHRDVVQARADGLRILHEKLGKNFQDLDFLDADLCGGNVSDADLSDANFSGADMRSMSFGGTRLTRAHFNGTELIYADFTRANLTGADFGGANLTGANFNGTELIYADFTRANLTGADFGGANLMGANLVGAEFKGTVYDQYTVFPDGSSGENNAWLREHPDIAKRMLFEMAVGDSLE